jgi:dienelactone hydrolase
MRRDCFIFMVSIFCIVVASDISVAKSLVESREVTYMSNGLAMKGFFAYDKNAKDRRPGVLVVPEWWGLNDYARKRANMLAREGYAALAVDMYGEGKVAENPDEAGKLSTEVMSHFYSTKNRFISALEYLKKQDVVDPETIAAIGYCFGGGVVLNMARDGADLKGVASFHGNLAAVKPAKPGMIKAKILVLAGDNDSFTTPQQILSFKEEMKSAEADMQFISYPGAKHSFTNPDADLYAKKFNLPIGYNAKADKASWKELQKFLRNVLKK